MSTYHSDLLRLGEYLYRIEHNETLESFELRALANVVRKVVSILPNPTTGTISQQLAKEALHENNRT